LDGSQVLYYSNRTGNYEVWILDRKNGADQNLTDSPDSADRLADWSPDGKEIVFMSDRGGSIELWIAKTAGGPPRQLTRQKLSIASHTAEAEGGPRWAPDGKLIAYLAPVKDGSAIWVADPQGVKVPQETSIRNAISFGWYKDSRRLLYIRRSGDGSGLQELVAADISTGEEKVLLRRPIAELAVAADGGALSFIHAVSHFTMDLWALRLKPTTQPGELPTPDGSPWQITSGKGAWHVHAGGWSRDASAVVYSRDKDFGDIQVSQRPK
jgi:dipeptidyl aminopeptidase/acylaminoacyl peptidase